MAGIVVGCCLAASAAVPDDVAPPSPPPPPARVITATVLPAASRLYDGQALRDMSSYAEMTGMDNFSSNGASITGVSVGFTGDVTSATQPLTEGMLAGFTVTVTDSTGYVQSFGATAVPVEYRARVDRTAPNEAVIDINPLVPDAAELAVTFSGNTGYDGTYTPTAGDLRNGVYSFAGTATIRHEGALSSLAAGSVLTRDLGLWSTPSGMLNITSTFRRNGIAIPGATGQTYSVTASDLGRALDLAVHADDGQQPPVTIFAPTPGLTIPSAPGAGPTIAFAAGKIAAGATGAGKQTGTIDAGAAATNKEIVLICAFGTTDLADPQINVTLNGVTPTQRLVRISQNAGATVAIFRHDASAGGSFSLSVSPASGTSYRGFSWRAYIAEKAGAAIDYTPVSASAPDETTPLDLSANVTTGNKIVGAANIRSGSTLDAWGLAGLTSAQEYISQGGKCITYFEASISSPETSRTMTATPANGAGSENAAALVIIS